jgi:hypothetical protein
MPTTPPATKPTAPTRDWTKPEDQRAAATAFLKETQTNQALRSRIVKSGQDDRNYAREQFRIIGDINIPNDVEVISVEPGTAARAKVVVFALPTAQDPMPSDLVSLKYWLAAWVPY